MSSPTKDFPPNDDTDASAWMCQKLMKADEVYVYKIPPLKTSGGHRAEDWNLAKPLQTCQLLVERRGDDLCLDFLIPGRDSSTPPTLFAQCHLDGKSLLLLHQQQQNTSNFTSSLIEPVVDSSRYFVAKIQGTEGRQATIGFGFRDREQAVDLRECIQHYERSLQREQQSIANESFTTTSASATSTSSYGSIPQGEKIHVNLHGRGKKISSTKNINEASPSSPTGVGGATSNAPLLLKRQPPPAGSQVATPDDGAATAQKAMERMSISMGDIDFDSEWNRRGHHHDSNAQRGQNDNSQDGEIDDDESSDGAVYEGTEDQWATEFDAK